METLKYTIIKHKKQYYNYCAILEALVSDKKKSKQINEEMELLTLLIEKWDEEHNTLGDADPIALLKYLMEEHNIRATNLKDILCISKSLMSDILNYRRGLSKDNIRKLSEHFKVSQELFNRRYPLVSNSLNAKLKQAS